ncbi:uncharacterized protein LOC133814814 [Humulus lupulus]|uniref:uncharacterized protein LOC133814814 n=1 Tax=Humulus lupulus TaxID=3486 RepID=UPI002B40DFF2|nr:uncharacterized protein LOC133814814 [Humulus lupulus]
MGGVKSASQKKKTPKPSENRPASWAEIPSTSGRAETTDPEIQTHARLRNAIRPNVELYLAPPSTITARMINMPSKEMFDMYSAPDAPASKKKASRRHRGKCSKEPPAKKTRTKDPPAAGPSKNTTPPPPPLEQQTPPAPVESTPSPPAPVDQTQPSAPIQIGDDISSRALRSTKDRMTRILRHERNQEAMARTESMDVDQILNRALNELASAMLTVTSSRLRSGVITEQSKSSEQRHAEELKAVEAKYAEQLEAAQKANAALVEEKNKLFEEMEQNQVALNKSLEAKEKYKESHFINFREAKKLEADLIESKQEAKKLEVRINDLEKANASNLESYLPERMRQTEIAQCIAHLEEEERAKIPTSPKISLAIVIEGVDKEAEAAIN